MWKGILKSSKNGNFNRYILVLSYVISVLVAALVYFTGGTSGVYANLMYIPIALCASTNGKVRGIILAVTSALLVGPFMPLDVSAGIAQSPFNWILRLAIYSMIALIIGFFSDYYRNEFDKSMKKDQELSEAQIATIFSMIKLAEFRDNDTGSHIERVAAACRFLAHKIRFLPDYQGYINDDYVDNIFKASPLHDIGKVGIPDHILLKPGKLTEHEFSIMKTHTNLGYDTLLEVYKQYPHNRFLKLGINIVRYHHEKWNGTGYPLGLSGRQIPLSARIMAIVDVYDALRSKRVYKEPYSHEESIGIIREGSGADFDPDITTIFLENESEFKNIYEKTEFTT